MTSPIRRTPLCSTNQPSPRRRAATAPADALPIALPPIRTWRGERIARWFGLPIPIAPQPTDVTPIAEPSQTVWLPETGEIVLLTGASGSGKSTLLRATASELLSAGVRVIDLAQLPLPDAPAVDCFPHLPLEEALMLLGRLGLGEAWTYLRTPSELSDGQRWRLRLAVAVYEAERTASLQDPRTTTSPASQPKSSNTELTTASSVKSSPAMRTVLVCDEFAALLDRVTAAVVARSIRRLIDASPNLSAVLATCHDDVIAALAPDREIRCDFGALACHGYPSPRLSRRERRTPLDR